MLGRRHEAVGQDVVVAIRAERSGKADAVHLDRRRPEREDLASRMDHVAAGIEEDGNPILHDATRRVFDRLRAHVDEVIERRLKTRPRRAAVVRAVRVTEHLEALPIVPLDHFGQEIRERVRAKVGPDIRDAQPAVDERG